ncbi:hypothetical protein EG68_04754 [Paragonimus skrjabini miyazakii]|uniref:Tc1-like transposase DDE domain-containing protein n=1 Tax=Paragonimus skrjabini miyazakii TaxID=59628 RepID=A0A8S9Z4F0_9TREM|nr:hypothetical protein EG68_04754 [Paragonimus skrjabini miyazakii]
MSGLTSTDVIKPEPKPENHQPPSNWKKRTFHRYTSEARAKVVEAFERGEDWKEAAAENGVNKCTAYKWISADNPSKTPKPRGGNVPKKLTEAEVNTMLGWLSIDPSLLLENLRTKVHDEFGKVVSTSCIGHNLRGQLYAIRKPCHLIKQNPEFPEKRRQLVDNLALHRAHGKQVLWIDEHSLNVNCSRNDDGTSRKAKRTKLLKIRGRPIHLVAAMTVDGLVTFMVKQGLYTQEHCRLFVQDVLERLEADGPTNRYVAVYDDAPCHSDLDTLLKEHDVTVLRLTPYVAELNPLDCLWTNIRDHAREQLRIAYERVRRTNPTSNPDPVKDPLMSSVEQAVITSMSLVHRAHCEKLVHEVDRFCEQCSMISRYE